MYYWRNYRYRKWRPRVRRYWRRRPGRPFRRRYWRRRRYRVRKKLKLLPLKQWQPHFIRKLKVKGGYPLFITTSDRLTNNFNCYMESVAPHKFPGGGGFQIFNFSLETLYKENLILKNWWTVGNDNMPLIRYLGCCITLYRQAEVDYMFCYNNAYPMVATKLTYLSTHPQAMLLHKHTKIMTCKRHNRNKKPYKKLYIKPPSQLQNKWYFAADLANQPLLQMMTTACSLDRMFLNANAVSTTIGLTVLNIDIFRNHNYTEQTTTGYQPIHDQMLFGIHSKKIPEPLNLKNVNVEDLIFLGNPNKYTEGTSFSELSNSTYNTFDKKVDAIRTQSGYWGNPFHPIYLHPDVPMLRTTLDWNTFKQHYTSGTTKLNSTHPTDFVLIDNKTRDIRYNPFKDKGDGNKVYLLKTDSTQHPDEWGPPADEDLIWSDFPLWLLTWGYLDFQKKCGTISTIDTKSVFVIQTKYIEGPQPKTYVLLDKSIINGHSPYDPDILIASDHFGYHPKVRFQVQSINALGTTGPAVAKLPEKISAEAHMGYKFYFKVGGQPPPMSLLDDPQNQPKYNIPNNFLQTTSLQNPTQPFEYYLWNFDERRGQLTKKATKRIQSDWDTEKTVFTIADSSSTCPTWTQKALQEKDSSTSEEEETPLEEALVLERRKQRLLRKRINLLLNRLTNIE
nr:MAG: ORF1 [TTV-like mini virus]